MSRRSVLACALALLLAGTAGCSGEPETQTESGTPSPAVTTASEAPTGETTPAPTAPPVTAEEPCPYLDQGYIEETVGQRISRVETITVQGQPAPDCIFYRNDQTPSVTIDLTAYADAVDAQNAALSLVTTAATPITDIGEYGGVLVAAEQTLLAVTRAALLVYVVTNQPSSLQAREIAATVLAAIPPG
ncbi:MAG: DUF2020 domain-containing protein [Geodermatophilaceae bacterium]|jgi:hypothetical protein